MRAKFLILNNSYPNGPYPESILYNIFGKCIRQLEIGSKEMKIKPTHMLVRLNSALMNHPVSLWLHRFDYDCVDEMFHFFRKTDQSEETKGKDSLTSQIFDLDLQAYQALSKAKISSQRSYPGKGGKRVNRQFWHDINIHRALIIDDYPDNCKLKFKISGGDNYRFKYVYFAQLNMPDFIKHSSLSKESMSGKHTVSQKNFREISSDCWMNAKFEETENSTTSGFMGNASRATTIVDGLAFIVYSLCKFFHLIYLNYS